MLYERIWCACALEFSLSFDNVSYFSSVSVRFFCAGSSYILFGEYVYVSENKNNNFKPSTSYPGVAFFLQNLFIFLASVTYKFGRTEDMWG